MLSWDSKDLGFVSFDVQQWTAYFNQALQVQDNYCLRNQQDKHKIQMHTPSHRRSSQA